MYALDPKKFHPLWQPFFAAEENVLSKILAALEDAAVTDRLCPAQDLIFRFASFDPTKLQVVILGQDPYPQKGAATGRSFEVGTLTDWTTPFRQTSLRNILRAIYKAKTGEDILWTALREKIRDGSFPILPPDKLFSALEGQGVLFLNTYLTCLAGEPLSHVGLWKDVSRKLIAYMDTELPNRTDTAWFLWGSHAGSYADLIQNGKPYLSRHPMLCGSYPDDFLKNPCFKDTADRINWTGI